MSQQLVNGKRQFIDGNGNPLAGGSVAFYLPGTLTPTNTWQDPALTVLNANPVVLDANGMATIWGADATQYRQIVQDALGNTIWDQVVGMIVSGYASAAQVQSGALVTAPDTGVANAYACALSPAPTAYTPGMRVTLSSALNTNTGASTLNVNGLGALPIQAAGASALIGGEIVATYAASFLLNGAGTAWVLEEGAGAWPRIAQTALAAPNNTPFALRNRIINGTFRVNQRAVSGTVTLAAGAYGHDRWKAGAAGCTYTFAANGSGYTLTVTAGSLMQVVEGLNVEGGSYVLWHAGTAQARAAVNGGTPSGAYATASSASPLALTGAAGGQALTVEFSTGTITGVQLEPGATATPLEVIGISDELLRCQRYYYAAPSRAYMFACPSSGGYAYIQEYKFPNTMRAAPTVVSTYTVSSNLTSVGTPVVGTDRMTVQYTGNSAANSAWTLSYTASAEL